VSTERGGLRRIASALSRRDFRIYTAGNAISLIGTWIQRIAVGWLVWSLTGSGAWLGVVAFADLFPAIVFGPFGGALADRLRRLTIIRVSQTVMMVQALALAVLTALDRIDIMVLLVLVLIGGVAMGINQPARLALVPSLVRRSDLPTAVAINSIVFNGARFVGPAVAGVLIVQVGVAAAFAVNALSFVAFLFALSRLRPRPEENPARDGRRSLLADVAEGFAYATRHPGIATVLALAVAISVGARPYVELLPGLADAAFARGAPGLATLASATGAGAVIGGLWLALRPAGRSLTEVATGSAVLAAATVLAFASSRDFALAVLLAALAGGFMVCAGVSAQILVQMAVVARMRGRVMSLYGLVFRAGPALGALSMGVASEWVGLQAPLAAGSALALGAACIVYTRRHRVASALEHPARE
jgi:predicted MFS family arabinose efflux permease